MEKIKVWQERQQRKRTMERSMCPGPKDDSHLRIRNGKGSMQLRPGIVAHLLICSSHHQHQLSSLVTGAGCGWVFATAQALQRGVTGQLFDRFCCAEVCALKLEHCNT